MIKRIRTLLTTFIVSSFFFLPIAIVPAVAHATTPNNVNSLCYGANLSVTSGQCSSSAGDSLNKVIQFVLNIFSVIVGITAVIMIVIGGFKYIISGGDSTKVSGAKDTILFAIVGLVIVALAQIIVHFVLHSTATQLNSAGSGS